MQFVPGMTGTLIGLEEDENARFRFEIWFDYTRQNINLVREGAMLAVPNFASSTQEQHLSILEIVAIEPMHYGLGTDTSGYPGFVIEAAKSAAGDWESQESEATEDTTKIKCTAIPTNLEIVQSVKHEQDQVQEESNIPMLGHTARLLDSQSTEFVVNYGIREGENVLPAGVLIRDAEVEVKVRVKDLLRTHFGVFGFTGAGKSNLVSTLVDTLLQHSQEPVKIVLFDLMSEYSTLLIDRLASPALDGFLIGLGEETLPGSVIDYFRMPEKPGQPRPQEGLDRAIDDLVRTTLLPHAISDLRPQFNIAMHALIKRKKLRIYRERAMTVDAYIAEIRKEIDWGSGMCVGAVARFINGLEADHRGKAFTTDIVTQLMDSISETANAPKIENINLTGKAQNGLGELGRRIQQDGSGYVNQRPMPDDLRLTIPELVGRLNDSSNSGLFIIQAHDPDQLRHFAWMLGKAAYENRRLSAQIDPLVSFIFDEADEFIPQGAEGTYRESSEIAMTLARRGRKFGLGLGIATQRVTYLNTNIMAQPHTYLVSKMPRKSDRERVSEAFGASEDIFRQTFKFKKGDWLLMSHDATGLDAIPVPIHTADTNARIREALKKAQEAITAKKAEKASLKT